MEKRPGKTFMVVRAVAATPGGAACPASDRAGAPPGRRAAGAS